MMSRLGDAKGSEVLREHERITREALAAYGGQEVKTMGGGLRLVIAVADSGLVPGVRWRPGTHSEAAIQEGEMVGLVDRQGSIVAQADLRRDGEDGRSFVLSAVRGKRSLLLYYCECGLREIWLNLGDVRLAGRLETNWSLTRRVWRVRLQGPGPVAAGDNLLGMEQVEDGCGHPGQGKQRERCRSLAQDRPAWAGPRTEAPAMATANRTPVSRSR